MDSNEKKKKSEPSAPHAKAEEPKEKPEEKSAEMPKSTPEEKIPEQSEELKKALADAEDFKRKWYSVTAEYENYRKRTARESAQRYAEGRADVVKGLLPIADNLERALQSCADEKTKAGITMVVKAFGKLLEEENIVPIDPLGEPFDAEKHEAIMAVDAEDGEESGTVKQVYLKGYERNGKVLRFAQVVVVK